MDILVFQWVLRLNKISNNYVAIYAIQLYATSLRISFMNKILATLITSTALMTSTLTIASEENFFQEYYDAASDAVQNLKKCSSNIDQFSSVTTTCYIEKSKYIQSKTQAFYFKNKSYFESKMKETGDDRLTIAPSKTIAALKQACVQTYPEPLRSHFKNQILECQAEIDLQRFFFFYTYKLNS